MNKEIAWLGLKSYLLNYADNESILGRQYYISDNADIDNVVVFAELIVKECIKEINITCEDLANGNIFLNNDELLNLVTRKYGKNKEREFCPVGIAVDIGNNLRQHFGIEQ